jgi:hypothetical protein
MWFRQKGQPGPRASLLSEEMVFTHTVDKSFDGLRPASSFDFVAVSSAVSMLGPLCAPDVGTVTRLLHPES